MDMDTFIKETRDALTEHIQCIVQKKSKMVPIDIEILSKDLCALEALTRIESELENGMESYSMHSGNSYRRGRGMDGRYVSRDNGYYDGGNFAGRSGRYHDNGNSGNNSTRYYDGGSGNSGYSGHSIHDRMIDNLERMMNEAQSDYERQQIQDEISRLRKG